MSDTSEIRNALNGHIDKQNQGDSATLRSALQDNYYNTLDQIYNLPYPDSTPSTPSKAVTTPAPQQQPQVLYKPNAAPTTPQTQTGGNWFSNLVDNFTANMKQGTDTLHDIPNLPDVIEPVGGALWAGANTVAGLFGDVAGTVGGGLNALDERMAADENAGQLPTNYKPFTEQVADIAGQYNERVANPIAGIGAKAVGSLASNLPNYTKENPTQNLLTAPTPDTQQTMDRAWKDLLSGNVIGAVDNGLRSFGDYGNEQFAQLDPKAALLASLIFDPLNFLPGAGIGEAQKAGKLGELTKGVARIEEAADLLPKGIMGRIGTPVAKVTEALNTGLKSLWHNTADLTNADEYFGTMRAFEMAGKDTKSFEQVLKTYAGLDTVPAQRIEKFMQGMTPHIDEVENAFRAVERGLQTGEDMGKLPKNFARFAEDVKAGKASPSDLFEFTKGEMISRLQDEMAKNSAKLYPLKNASAPANIANRFLNNLKGFEALVYIGLSPITFVRNIVNGLTTMAIEGVNPFFSATGEIARLRKLGQVERAADLQRAMKFHETLLNTGGLVRQAYGQGQFATGATGPLGSFMSKMIHGSPLGKPLQWYQQIENGMRQKVWTGTYYNAIRHNVDRIITPIDAATEAVLHQYRVPTSDVTNVIKEGLLTGKQPGAIMRDLNDLMDGKRATSVDWGAVADEMGVPREHLNALLDEHDQAKAYQMAQEIAARVANGEDKAAVVEEVVAQAASEATQATAERIGADVAQNIAPEERLTQIETRMQEIDASQSQLMAGKGKIPKANRAAYDELEGELNALQDEQRTVQESLGYTNEEMLFGKKPPPDVPPEAPTATAPEPTKPIEPSGGAPAMASPLDENPLPPVDLPTAQLSPSQEKARAYLLTLTKADGSPLYTAEQLATWKPDSIDRIAGELQTARVTMDDVLKVAQGKGISTATAEGRPNNRHLLNVLNKHKQEGAAQFRTIDDVKARADEARKILEGYAPEAKAAKQVANVSDASARVTTEIPEGQVFNEQGLIEEIGKQNDALNEIEKLRNIAQEDEQATKILSRDEMVKAKARTQADMLEALYNLWNRDDVRRLRVGSDAKNRVMAYGRREVVKAANDLRMAATVAADHMDNAVMISRDGETRFDAALSVLAPFQFWRSRFALQSLRRVADKPARLAWYLKLRDMQDSVHDDPRFPKRLRGMLELPWLGVPQWAGGSMFFDPLEFGNNVESVFGLNQFKNSVDDSDVAQSIRALAGRGAVNADEAANAIANRKGALWEQTKQRLEQLSQSTEGLSAFSDMFRPHMPLDILWKLKTGNAADIGVLFPMSRIIRAATGVNPEGFIKQGLRNLTGNQEIPDWDAWEQYRTDRALADMVGNGELNERDALLALIERKGQYYEKAQQRAQEQMQMQTFSVFGGQLFPQGEREYYKARVTRDQLINQAVASLGSQADPAAFDFLRAGKATHPDEIDARDEYDTMMAALQSGQNTAQAIAIAQSHLDAHQKALAVPGTMYDPYPGQPQKNQAAVDGFRSVIAALQARGSGTGIDPNTLSYGEKMDLIKANGLDKKGTPLGDFYTTYPVYGSRQDVYAEPEGRMKGFLTDEMWTRYNSLSALDKRKVKNENKDLASFINNPERDYAAVTIDQMGTFVKTLRGYLPASDLTPKIGNVNQISYASPDQSARYQNILDTQKQYFNLDAMQPKLDTYSNLSVNDKRAYRVANPDVDAYFDWYGAQMRANPDISKILNPDYQQATYLNPQAATNSVMRQVSSNLNYMVRRIGDESTRRFTPHGGGSSAQGGTPQLSMLSPTAQAELKKKWANPSYYIGKASYGELFALYRKYRMGAQSFAQWLQLWQQQLAQTPLP